MRNQQHIGRYGISVSVLAVSLSVLAGATAPAAFAADSRGKSSVDSGEIRWEDGTKFDDARKWAATAWYNTEYKLTKIKIAPDAWNTITDLEWKDENRKDVSWVAQWRGKAGADAIVMNKAYLDDGKKYGTKAWRRKAAAHEMGHALGLGHRADGNLLAKTMGGLPSNARPTSTDRAGYNKLWG
ncbi:matrixin family metalloprotease [Streptomyces sp. ME02-6991-2A]|uniref:matrixin family metalloprotease n=1 Tax=Streptomyces arboris TaxID=2600619 RepID=UPI0029A101B1|nr:matrixin family metalloprotease [Streptomyces sp. ME02-6991-2A]